MAKVNAPLFSFNASGKIANALVYFGWKGLDVVRSYVVPTNPDSDPQKIQRDYMRKCVAKIHVAQADDANPLDAEDLVAYAALGSLKATPRTWFNSICKNWIDVKVAVKKPVVYREGQVLDAAHDACHLRIWFSPETSLSMSAGKFYWGSSKSALINSAVADNIDSAMASNPANLITTMVAGAKYYWQFRADDETDSEGTVSGIYSFVAT